MLKFISLTKLRRLLQAGGVDLDTLIAGVLENNAMTVEKAQLRIEKAQATIQSLQEAILVDQNIIKKASEITADANSLK